MINKGSIIKSLIITALMFVACWGLSIYSGNPMPEVFVVSESPLELSTNTEVQFVDMNQLYPDESYMTFECVCEDESIAVIDNKISVRGVSKGTTKIKCEARGKLLAELEVIVK